MSDHQDIDAALLALETRRIAATSIGDAAVLEELYAPGMTFVHLGGRPQARDAYIAVVAQTPRPTEFGPLTIALYDDMAIMTGTADITLTNPAGESRIVNTYATRVLQRTGEAWRYVFIQVAAFAPPT
jgi:ketosteroid isomerase-like protein